MGQLVSKIKKIVLGYRVDISKNNNIGHRVTETCAIVSAQVKYENNHSSLLQDSTISSALNLFYHVLYCNLEEKDHIKKI